jgi:RHO1 GDP-GTP exchange protein 1/2
MISERQVITFPLDALDPLDPMAGLKRAKRISSHTSFFKAGFCLGRVLVCIVKSSQLSSTFKTLEPIDQNIRGRAKPTFKKLLQGGNDTLKLFRVNRASYLIDQFWNYLYLLFRSFIFRWNRLRYII